MTFVYVLVYILILLVSFIISVLITIFNWDIESLLLIIVSIVVISSFLIERKWELSLWILLIVNIFNILFFVMWITNPYIFIMINTITLFLSVYVFFPLWVEEKISPEIEKVLKEDLNLDVKNIKNTNKQEEEITIEPAVEIEKVVDEPDVITWLWNETDVINSLDDDFEEENVVYNQENEYKEEIEKAIEEWKLVIYSPNSKKMIKYTFIEKELKF